VKRNKAKFQVDDTAVLKQKLTLLLSEEKYVCWLDSCQQKSAKNMQEFETLVAFGQISSLQTSDTQNSWAQLEKYQAEINDWIFGILSYDLKNELHPQLPSKNANIIELPLMVFFQARTIFFLRGGELEIHSYDEPKDIFSQLMDCTSQGSKTDIKTEGINPNISKDEYVKTIHHIKSEIKEGNVYEVNYCINYSLDVKSGLEVVPLFHQLAKISPAPFAGVFKHGDYAMIGASPERYIRKQGSHLISQPIKGTRPRGLIEESDLQLKIELQNSLKERAENVMIVDLVRNDLAKNCIAGSVVVSELFGIYSYEQVHQMVSTIEGELKPNISWINAIKSSFPMGSMTGAPKIAAMKLIDEIENFNRGWYSGALGYVSPNGDYDFNVIIRSLVCNTATNKMSFAVGGAITYDSSAEEEWNECQLKAKAIKKLLDLELD
jgi:para-aminobenzoate synthetase component I